jgi:hypothetical protein
MYVTYRPANPEDLEPGLCVVEQPFKMSCAAGMGCARWRSASPRFSASSTSKNRPASGAEAEATTIGFAFGTKSLKGDARKSFMSGCLKADHKM